MKKLKWFLFVTGVVLASRIPLMNWAPFSVIFLGRLWNQYDWWSVKDKFAFAETTPEF